jgi:hypothetical protein
VKTGATDLTGRGPAAEGAAVATSTTSSTRNAGRTPVRTGPNKVALAVGAAIALAAIAIAAVVGIAHATSSSHSTPEQAFLADTQPYFPGVKTSALTSLGHHVCDTFAQHQDDPSMAEYDIASAASKFPKLPPADMVVLIRSAVTNFCPSYQFALPSSTTTSTPAP